MVARIGPTTAKIQRGAPPRKTTSMATRVIRKVVPKSGSSTISPRGRARIRQRMTRRGMESWRWPQASRCRTIHQATIITESGLNSSEGWRLWPKIFIQRWAWFTAGKK